MTRWLFRLSAAITTFCLSIVFFLITIVIVKKVFFSKDVTRKDHIAVIELSGMILSSQSILKELEENLEHPGLKAIILRINSPGGLVAPSQEIYEGFKKADQKVPVYVSMGALAASGGYYAAMAGRKIYANPGTLTASIGVIMEFANTQKLYQWAKVERYTIKAGKMKDVGSPLREMKPEERELLQGMANNIHEQFRATVKERRKLTVGDIEKYADGRVMTGEQALKVKLVDELKGIDDVIVDVKKALGLPDKTPVQYPESKGLFRKLVEGEEASWDHSVFGRILSVIAPTQSIPHDGWKVMLIAPVL